MLKSRRLSTENLEKRRLLAASMGPLGADEACEVSAEVSILFDASEPATASPARFARGLPQNSLRAEPLGSVNADSFLNADLVQEVDGRLYAVDQDPASGDSSTLHIFDRLEDGSLSTVGEFELEMFVRSMVVSGDQVVLLGSGDLDLPSPNEDSIPILGAGFGTSVLTISLGDSVTQFRQTFDDFTDVVSHDGDTLVLASSTTRGPALLIFPPRPTQATLAQYQITADGLVETGSQSYSSGDRTRISDSEFLVTTTSYEWTDTVRENRRRRPFGPSVTATNATLTRVNLDSSPDDDSTADSVSLGAGYIRRVTISEDGSTATAIRETQGDNGRERFIDVIDLSGDSLQLLRSISLNDDVVGITSEVRPIQLANDQLLVRGASGTQLLVISLGELDADATDADRFSVVELPAGFTVGDDSLRLSADTVLLTANSNSANQGLSPRHGRHDTDSFLTVSISQAAVIAQSAISSESIPTAVDRLELIDATSQQVGFHRFTRQDGSRQESYVLGRIDDDGVFSIEGEVPLDTRIEIDATADRLIVRQSDRLLEYAWDDIENPTITPIGDPLPDVTTTDDEFVIVDDGETQWIDVVANDVNALSSPFLPRITELIGAPEGAEIVGRNFVRIPPSAVAGAESLQFQYVLSNGRSQSTANVNLTVVSTETDPRVAAVVRQAAEDLDVAVDQISVTNVAYFVSDTIGHPGRHGHTVTVTINDHGQTIVIEHRDNGDPSTGGVDGLHVRLSFPGGTATYESELTTGIRQIAVNRDEVTEDLVELGLRTVDANGEPVTTINQGDEFWIELTAQDLRDSGSGVYGAFFDLEISNSAIELTGDYEVAPAFQQIGTPTITSQSVDELGAVGVGSEVPGNSLQPVLRMKARAIAAGAVSLALDPADTRGAETLLHGIDTEIPDSLVRYGTLTLNVAPVVDEVVVQQGLRAVGDDGAVLPSVVEGDEFWIEFTAQDLRSFGAGVFATFTDIELTGDAIEFTGEYEFDSAFRQIGEPTITANSVDELGGVAVSTTAAGNDEQRILRLRGKAVGSGAVNLSMNPADTVGAETLLLGIDSVIPSAAVSFGELTIEVEAAGTDSVFDTDGNGEVTVLDALRVINLLSREGTAVALQDVAVTGEGEAAMSTADYAALARHDVNRGGNITVLDALMVVNQLSKQASLDAADGELVSSRDTVAADDGRDDDDDDDDRDEQVSEPDYRLGSDLV